MPLRISNQAHRTFYNPRPTAYAAIRSQNAHLLSRRSLTAATATPTTRIAPEAFAETPTLDLSEGAEDDASATPSTASKSRLDAISRRRLQFLRDPYTIGKHVESVLEKDGRGGYEEALNITRMASKDQQVTVSWNHLIGYLMRKERLVDAIKIFNEVSNAERPF